MRPTPVPRGGTRGRSVSESADQPPSGRRLRGFHPSHRATSTSARRPTPGYLLTFSTRWRTRRVEETAKSSYHAPRLGCMGRGRLPPMVRLAASAGVKAPVRFYLRSGRDPNATDSRCRTLLLLAAKAGRTDVCRLLMESGADPTLRDADGIDALSAAIRNRHTETADVLRAYLARLAPPPAPRADQARTADSSRIGNRPENVPPDPDGDDQTLNLDDWEEQHDAPPPADAPELRASATALQSGISAHSPIDSDHAWADVEIDLPRSAVRLDPAHVVWLDVVRSLIHYGLSWGWVTRHQVAEVAGRTGTGDGREEIEIHLRLVLGEVGVMVDENVDEPFMTGQLWRDWQDGPPSEPGEDGHRAIINEAVAFLATEAVPFLRTSGRSPGPAHLLSEDLRTLGVASFRETLLG